MQQDPAAGAEYLAQFELSDALRTIIARTAREFEETGHWVTFDTLAYEAAQAGIPSGLNDVFRVPSVLGGAWGAESVSLTALGLLVAGTAPHTSETLARLAQICAERKLQLRDQASIGKQILIDDFGFSPDEAQRAVDLISMLPGISGGGRLGDDWSLMIHRSALDYLNVRNVPDLLSVLQTQAQESLRVRQQSLAVAPAFAPGGMFGEQLTWSATLPPRAAVPEPDDPTAVFVVHGRDDQAKAALWAFLSDLGLHPLDWEDDLVAQTGQGSPFIGQVLDAAFAHAQAVIVLMTPDDAVRLHKDLVRPGEQSFERRAACQPRPNVLFEAGMAFGYCPSRTILVEIGSLRPISDLGGRHTIRLGVEDTLRALARRLEVAGCPVNRSNDSWLNVQRFSDLQARARRP